MASQLTFTCWKSTIETPEKDVDYVDNKNIRMTSVFLFWCFYGWLGTYVKPFSNVSIVDFEQVYGSWVKCDGSNCLKWGKLDLQLFQIQFPQTSFKNNFYFIVSFFVPKVWKILCWCWISEVSLTWLDLKNYHENDRYLLIYFFVSLFRRIINRRYE